MNDVVKMGKCGCVSPAIWLVQGDTRSHILTIRVPRMESGVDLKDLAWKINITNEAGVDDVDVPVMGSVVIDERTIAFDWLIHGVATAVPGKTIFSVEGVDETEDGKPIIWRSSPAMIYIREKHDATPSEEVETELGELEKMIVYVNGELTNVIAAGEMARSAATHPPIIGDNGNWFLWDLEKEIYVDSGKNARGPKGDHGETAYEIAKENGFEGTEEEWLDYLRADSDKLMLIGLTLEQDESGGYFLSHDYTLAEIQDAVRSGKTLFLRDHMGRVYQYYGEDVDDDLTNKFPYFITVGKYTASKGLSWERIIIKEDYRAATRLSPVAKTPNPYKLKFTGEIEDEYDGSRATTVNIKSNVFVVKLTFDEDCNFVVDKTQAEVKQAVADGKAVIMLDVDVGTTLLYMGEGTMDGEQCPFFVSPLSEVGMTSLLANIVYLKKSGEVVYMNNSPINPLIIHYGDQEYYFDGSKLTSINIKDDVFVIRVDENGKADKTQAETIAAKDSGKAVILVTNSGEVFTYTRLSVHPDFPSDLSPLFTSPVGGDVGEKKFRTLAYLLSDKTVKIRTEELNTSGGSGGITQETDPTVPAWAKQPNKPGYTADEVGAASKESVDKLSEEIVAKHATVEIRNSDPEVLEMYNGRMWIVLDGAEEPDVPVIPENPLFIVRNYGLGFNNGVIKYDWGINVRISIATLNGDGISPAISAGDTYVSETAYPIPVPYDATTITVACDGLMWGVAGFTYKDGTYTYNLDPGWKASGATVTFAAGSVDYVVFNLKDANNGNIPDSFDTSGIVVTIA